MAIAASLIGAAWFGVQYYRSHGLPGTEVANLPTVEKPVAPPTPKPPKPTPKKPEIENARPPEPPPVATVKDPTPAPKPAPDPTPVKGETLPVIPVDATPDPTAAGAPLPQPVVASPNAKPGPRTPALNIIDAKIPIRPAKPLDPKAAKSSTPTKKNDTIVELKNGYTLRGRIKRVKDDQLTLGVPGGEFTFAMDEVKVLDSSAPEYLTEADMPAVSIVLKGGQRLRGKLLKQDADHVVLVVANGQIVVDRIDIREVSFTGRIHF
jgi:small nuclear ribonucleoprotein (snRNP)-like protein